MDGHDFPPYEGIPGQAPPPTAPPPSTHPPAAPPPGSHSPGPESTSKRGKGAIIAIVIIALLVCCCLGGGVATWIYAIGQDDPDAGISDRSTSGSNGEIPPEYSPEGGAWVSTDRDHNDTRD